MSDQPTPIQPIHMGVAADGSPVWFQPHGPLCASFAERTSAYLHELDTLSADMRALAAAIPPPVTRRDPRQRLHADKLAERHAHLQTKLQRLVARMVNLRGELNAHFAGAALACPDCATALASQRWPLPGSEDLLSEVLRRAAAVVRAAHQ